MIQRLRSALLLPWPIDRPHRLYDGRAGDLGPYYVTFGRFEELADDLAREHAWHRRGENDPLEILQSGLNAHARWVRTDDERAREAFLAHAQWAANAQEGAVGVRGFYSFPYASAAYGCGAGFISAKAQGEAISLLLRAYEETREQLYLERAIDASVPMMVDVRKGGVLWQSGDDCFLEGIAGPIPSHILGAWISALWGIFELLGRARVDRLRDLYEHSLATLEKYLPCYDSGSWSYGSLLASSAGIRRSASLRRHALHVAQLNVLLSMTKNDLFAVVAERWRNYGATLESRFQAWASALPSSIASDVLTVRGGARSIV